MTAGATSRTILHRTVPHEARATAASLRNVSFAYKNAPETVHDVSLSVASGECVVLCGPSGSGKTTLVRVINGLAGSYCKGTTEGVVKLGECDATNLEQWERAEWVGSVFQDPSSQFFSSQLAGEIAFTCENLGYDHERVVAATDQAISAFSLDSLRKIPNDSLSSGQKQKVAIASALGPRPQLLAMDEPSSNLDEEAAVHLGRTLARLKAEGLSMVIAEHRLAYLMDVADRFLLVRDGRIEQELSRTDVFAASDDLRRSWGLRDPRRTARPKLPHPNESATKLSDATEPPALEMRGLRVAYRSNRIFEDVSLTVEAGQIVALTGRNGAGKTTLARILGGLKKTQAGSIRVHGRTCSYRDLRRRVWFGPNDVKAEFFTPSVKEEAMLLVKPDETHKNRARGILHDLDLWELREQHPATLSGGQKQRLSIACGLMSDRTVLVFDEPTSGLDALNMEVVAGALETAAREGRAIIVVTHDNEFIGRCCTHIFELE